MPIIAEAKASVPPMDNGTYFGRCYQMIELGTQTETFEEKEQTKKKVLLTFELPEETYEIELEDGTKETRIRTAQKEFALSMHKKANLRQFLQGWRGKDFTEEEAKKFDITVLLGKFCNLSIQSNKKGYPVIMSASPLKKSEKPIDAVHKNVLLEFDNWNQKVFESLPEYIRKKIEKSPEHTEIVAKQAKANKPQSKNPGTDPKKQVEKVPDVEYAGNIGDEDGPSDLPF